MIADEITDGFKVSSLTILMIEFCDIIWRRLVLLANNYYNLSCSLSRWAVNVAPIIQRAVRDLLIYPSPGKFVITTPDLVNDA